MKTYTDTTTQGEPKLKHYLHIHNSNCVSKFRIPHLCVEFLHTFSKPQNQWKQIKKYFHVYSPDFV